MLIVNGCVCVGKEGAFCELMTIKMNTAMHHRRSGEGVGVPAICDPECELREGGTWRSRAGQSYS